jgi:hypothetical protein
MKPLICGGVAQRWDHTGQGEKKKYELLVRLVCSAIAGYICNVEMMQLRNKLGGHDAFSCRENLNQSTHL